MVEALLKAGAASSGERERDGQTPLHAAAEGGRYRIRIICFRTGPPEKYIGKKNGPGFVCHCFVGSGGGDAK